MALDLVCTLLKQKLSKNMANNFKEAPQIIVQKHKQSKCPECLGTCFVKKEKKSDKMS